MQYRRLHGGIDSLYVSYEGRLKAEIGKALEKKKTMAQSENKSAQAEAVFSLGEHNFEVMDKGRGKYKYILRDAWFQILVAENPRRVPVLQVQVSSELLNGKGVIYAMSHLRGIIDYLIDGTKNEIVSRVDGFLDIETDMDFDIGAVEWATRALKKAKRCSGNRCIGWEFGNGGAIYARLYDKTYQIGREPHAIKDIWHAAGWADERVWRLEFQWRREFLRQMGVQTVEDFLTAFNDLWCYSTKWLRLTIEEGTRNRTRWKTHPLWHLVQSERFGDGAFRGVQREVRKSRIPSERVLFVNGGGFLTSHAAWKGRDSLDEEAMLDYLKDMRAFHERNPNPKYSGFADYVRTVIMEKKKKFNIASGETHE